MSEMHEWERVPGSDFAGRLEEATQTPSNHLPLLGTGATLVAPAGWVYAHQRQALAAAGQAISDALGIHSHERAQQAAEAAIAAYLHHMRESVDAR